MGILMPEGIAKRLAFNLYTMTLSELPVANFDFSVQNCGGQKERQQFAVDMLYRCWKSSLIEVFDDVVAKNLGIQGADEFVGRLSRASLFEDCLSDEGVIWHAAQFEATASCVALLSRSVSREVDMDDPIKVLKFNRDTCDLFAEHGVPWQDGALFPIHLGIEE